MFCELLDLLLSSPLPSSLPSPSKCTLTDDGPMQVQRGTMAKLLNMRSKNLTGDMSPSYVVYMDIKIFYYSDYKTVLGYNFTLAEPPFKIRNCLRKSQGPCQNMSLYVQCPTFELLLFRAN